MDITYQYTKRRSSFGRQPLFCEMGPLLCDSIAAHPPEHKNYILRNPVHQLTQHTPRYSHREINTIRAELAATGINHAEGGWPLDVHVQDPEATQRYRRRIEKDDTYIHCVMALSPAMEYFVRQNNAIDMYRSYYTELEAVAAPKRLGCRTVNVYRDPHAPAARARPVSSICWQPEGGHRFAVTYLDMDFDRNPRSPFVSYIWDVERALEPADTITPPRPLADLRYNLRDRNLLAGGLVNGQVAGWDARAGPEPFVVCEPHVAHRDLVRNVIFINTKSGQELFSSGPDGCCKWWDLRNMTEPTDEMIMDVVKSPSDVQSMGNASGVSVLEYEPTVPTRFMVGTENGLVIGANRKGKTPMEKLPLRYETHVGPVYSLERNPGFLKNFLTVGDWTARVWSEECRESAILWTPPHRHKITAGTWSPTRLSLMVLTQWNGVLSLWDLLHRQHEPVLTMQVCYEPLLQIKIQEAGNMVACGSQNGHIYMVELTSSLADTEKNDKGLLTAMFERESKRERILEARLREIRLKLRQAEEASPAASLTDLDTMVGDRDLAEATAAFTQQVKRELATI